MSRRNPVTAVVLAHNEERHLPDCLASLVWADEILVLDSGSTDRTAELAAAAGVRVEMHPFENFSRQRAFALSRVLTPWVLFVDADERVPAPLAAEIDSELVAPRALGYWIPRHNYFWGHRLQGGGWWPDHQLRLLAVRHARYDPERAVHEVAEVDGPTGYLRHPLVHLNYDNFAEFAHRQLAYARLEARRRASYAVQPRLRHLVLQPWREFVRRFITLGGWRDGLLGLSLALWMAIAEFETQRQVRRLRASRRRDLPSTGDDRPADMDQPRQL